MGCLTTSVSSQGSNRETNLYKMKVLGIKDPDIEKLSCKIQKLQTENLVFYQIQDLLTYPLKIQQVVSANSLDTLEMATLQSFGATVI